ncbi:MAG: ABC transporter permease [Candidatus Endonucleobacter bathymodioli]|uniref:ABC transporter permease n=1 Tax=Candidatus Endonucleibacter bathymodioli TaxID=539814 RepID=A0AA90NV66_9GAMM|nr:ABC transporter permease [Candidatus Endonucleobacter bathymodioli]
MISIIKPAIVFLCLLIFWKILVVILDIPFYILPAPDVVLVSIQENIDLLWENTLVTMSEMLLGLLMGVFSGISLALALLYFSSLRPWLLPLLLITQAIPTFALAPILMLWFGYGMASKVVMTMLMIFFPVVTCCYDGLRHAQREWLDMAQIMGGSNYTIMRYINWPGSLPRLASGLRIAVVIAPIGAVVGEWVGSSAGLGYMMIQANARLWVDQMFAALAVLAFCSTSFYFITDRLLHWLIPWEQESSNGY